MKKFLLIMMLALGVLLTGCGNGTTIGLEPPSIEDPDIEYGEPDLAEIIEVARAATFRYHLEIAPNAPNLIVGPTEIGGKCTDYATWFVVKWNERYPGHALLVLTNTKEDYLMGIGAPSGVYKLLGKDERDMPEDIYTVIYKGIEISTPYLYEGVRGMYLPKLGKYKIQLVEEKYIKSHFGDASEAMQAHAWALVGSVSVEPTFFDTMGEQWLFGVDVWK
jgi:hypothetical protein